MIELKKISPKADRKILFYHKYKDSFFNGILLPLSFVLALISESPVTMTIAALCCIWCAILDYKIMELRLRIIIMLYERDKMLRELSERLAATHKEITKQD